MLTLTDRIAPTLDVVEVVRPLWGRSLPNNHGYLLFAALSAIGWVGHGEDGVQVLPVIGTRGRGTETLLDARSTLVIRAPLRIAGVLARLPGPQLLDVGGSAVLVGSASLRQLRPSPRAFARMVTIQHSTAAGGRHAYGETGDVGEFRAAACRKLVELGVNPAGVDVLDRRTLRVRDRIVVGFGVRLTGLPDADSIRVQAVGVGGRRRFGCGGFVPC